MEKISKNRAKTVNGDIILERSGGFKYVYILKIIRNRRFR